MGVSPEPSTNDITDRVRSEEEVRASQRLLQRVLETIPVGVAVMDGTGAIVLSNAACRRIWGDVIAAPDERYRRSKGYWHTDGRRVEASEWGSARALRKGETSLNELLDIETLDGRRLTIQNSAVPIRDDEDRIVGAVVVMEDVTERVQAETALHRTQRLLTQAERLGETGSWEQDLVTGEIVDSEENRRLFFGDRTRPYRFEDYAEAVHPDDRARVLGHRSRALDGDSRGEIEYRVVWPDGSVHHLFSLNHVVRDSTGRAVRAYGTNTDVTRRKAAEEEVARQREELRALSRKLIAAQEAERRLIARELHDDFGQVLTAIKINLLRKEGDGTESIALVDGAIARMRDLAQDLRPPMLDELGLEAALRSHVDREARRAGLRAELDIRPLPRRFTPSLETTCFRVVQEALTNVIRHAGATSVRCRLQATDNGLTLEVNDDGIGFDPVAVRRRADSQGLVGMRERVELAGGELEIQSQPGQGTTVRARFAGGSDR
jgi:PAS domain S-box-containing protein